MLLGWLRKKKERGNDVYICDVQTTTKTREYAKKNLKYNSLPNLKRTNYIIDLYCMINRREEGIRG